MTVDVLRDVLLWCSVINVGLLLFSFLLMTAVRGFAYRMHSRWFPMPEEQFNGIIYGILGMYKILIFVFNIVPWIALVIVT